MKVHFFFFTLIVSQVLADYEKKIIKAFTQVSAHGEGNIKAVEAMDWADQLRPNSIPSLLHAMNQANPVGDNWIRGAIAKIIHATDTLSFPRDQVKAFIEDKKNQGSSRRAAFEILHRSRPASAKTLLSCFLTDPEPSLRREAIDVILEDAENSPLKKQAILLFQKALKNARDVDQIQEASDALKSRGQEINLVTLLGFKTKWDILGPFDNTERKGFNKSYEPESEARHNNSYRGKNSQIQWTSFSSSDRLGLLDLNKHYGELKEVVAYAKTSFYSAKHQKVQFRLGSKNAWKIWVNQELLFARDEYHRGGTRVDQFLIDGELQKGENQILLKICQNEQTQPWTKNWEFCFRVTDSSGQVIEEVSTN